MAALSSERLSSGLRLVVEPRTAAPVVALWLRVGVGALYERDEEAGAAHFVEHMLFKGSRAPGERDGLAPGEIGPVMDELGADLNAYTTHEETVVHCVVPKEHAERALSLLGQLAFRCWFEAEQVARERDVVLDELARGQDDASRLLAEGMARRAWGRHPYGRSVLGTQPSVQAMGASSLRSFHARWYHPSNAHLVVVGDIEPAAVRSIAGSTAFQARGPVPSAPFVPPTPAAPRGFGFVRVCGSFEEQILELAMRVPGHGHPDLPAIDLLCSAMGEGASAILPQRLHLDRRVAHSAWAVTEIGTRGGMLLCGAAPSVDDPGETLEALGDALHELRVHGVPVDAFQRAKSAILADRAYSEESAEGRASFLSFYLGNYGDIEAEQAYRGRIEALRPRDIDRVARTWIQPQRSTVGIVGQDVRLGLAEAQDRLRVRPRARSPRDRSGAVQRKILPNGLRLLVEPQPDASVTSLRALGLGGTLLETPATAGHGLLWAELLAEGAGPLQAETFAAAIEGLSGSMGGFSSLSVLGISASFPADRFPVGLHLLTLPLLQPRFDEEAVARVRDSALDAIRSRHDSGAAKAWDALMGMAFAGHPYRLAGAGTERSVAGVAPAAMHRFHRRAVSAENLVVAVSGAVQPEAVFRALGPLLAQLPKGCPRLPRPPSDGTPRRRRRVLRGAWQQAQIMVGFRGCALRHPDRAALDVLGALLGSPGGRLFQQLRDEAGLSYDVQANHLSGLQGGLFTCGMGVTPGRLREAGTALDASLEQLRRDPPSHAELERAISALVGAEAMDLQRSSYRALRMAQDERFGLDGRRYLQNLDDVRGVALDRLHEVIHRYLAPERALRVTARR
jgi:zinc protease